MEQGTLEQTYRMVIRGIDLPGPQKISVPAKSVKATIDYQDAFILRIEIDDTTRDAGSALADQMAQEIYERFLLEWAVNVELSAAPQVFESSFTSKDSTAEAKTATVKPVGEGALIARGTVTPPQWKFEKLAWEVEIRLRTPQLATSAQLYTTIKMFSVGMQSDDKVVRFLILYSAITLAALFKHHVRTQEKVDELLKAVNSTLPINPTGKGGKLETLYTKLRNDFVHAEERGYDPEGARRDIEQHIMDFQRDTALIFKSL